MRIVARTVNINPQNDCYLGGNGESVLSNSIHSDLEANLLIILEETSSKLIITMDLLYVGEIITEAIKKIASEYFSADCIWISSSHSHNAPHVDLKKPKLGTADPAYINLIIDRLNKEIRNMVAEMENGERTSTKVKISYAPFTVNRRKKRLLRITKRNVTVNKVYMQPHKKGKTDPQIRKLEFLNEKQQLVALLWQYTCHPTSFYEPNSISSHFVGEIREQVRSSASSRIPVLFMQGFAGDVRPPSVRRFYEKVLQTIFQGREFRNFTKSEYVDWITKLVSAFHSDKEAIGSKDFSKTQPLKITWDSALFVADSPSSTVTLQIMPLGPICMVGLSCEPTVNLSTEILNYFDTGQIWPCGYLEDVYGYLPSSDEILLGGYEVDGFRRSFDCGELNTDGWDIALAEIRRYFDRQD
jgi:hypothetical protein